MFLFISFIFLAANHTFKLMGLCVLMSDNFIVFQTGEWRRMSLPAIKQRVRQRERGAEEREIVGL